MKLLRNSRWNSWKKNQSETPRTLPGGNFSGVSDEFPRGCSGTAGQIFVGTPRGIFGGTPKGIPGETLEVIRGDTPAEIPNGTSRNTKKLPEKFLAELFVGAPLNLLDEFLKVLPRDFEVEVLQKMRVALLGKFLVKLIVELAWNSFRLSPAGASNVAT